MTSRRRFPYLSLALLVMCVLYSAQTLALSDEQRADQLLLQAQAALQDDDHAEAVTYLERILALDVSMPGDFYFFYGNSLAEINRDLDAYIQLSRYLQRAGRGARHYQEALSVHASVESRVVDDMEASVGELEEAISQWRWMARSTFIDPDRIDTPGLSRDRLNRWMNQGDYLQAATLIQESLSEYQSRYAEAEAIREQRWEFSRAVSDIGRASNQGLRDDLNPERWSDRYDQLVDYLRDGELEVFRRQYRTWMSELREPAERARNAIEQETERLEEDLQAAVRQVRTQGRCRQLLSKLEAFEDMGNDSAMESLKREVLSHGCNEL